MEYLNENKRPEVEFNSEIAKEFEHFQGTVLRPILKLQNENLLQFMNEYLEKTEKNLSKLNVASQKNCIELAVKTNKKLREKIIKAILLEMNVAERKIYKNSEREFNKRLSYLLIERFTSQLSKIVVK